MCASYLFEIPRRVLCLTDRLKILEMPVVSRAGMRHYITRECEINTKSRISVFPPNTAFNYRNSQGGKRGYPFIRITTFCKL